MWHVLQYSNSSVPSGQDAMEYTLKDMVKHCKSEDTNTFLKFVHKFCSKRRRLGFGTISIWIVCSRFWEQSHTARYKFSKGRSQLNISQ
jgi:hypothetical protein